MASRPGTLVVSPLRSLCHPRGLRRLCTPTLCLADSEPGVSLGPYFCGGLWLSSRPPGSSAAPSETSVEGFRQPRSCGSLPRCSSRSTWAWLSAGGRAVGSFPRVLSLPPAHSRLHPSLLSHPHVTGRCFIQTPEPTELALLQARHLGWGHWSGRSEGSDPGHGPQGPWQPPQPELLPLPERLAGHSSGVSNGNSGPRNAVFSPCCRLFSKG